MKTRYVLVTIALPEEQFDLASGVLSTYPMMGIEEGMDKITVCFEQNDWQEDFRESILNEMHASGVDATITLVGTEEDQNWNAEWEASVEPVVVNERIVIAPEWRAADYPDVPMLLVITPKMSFGTGHHATTRMMCRLMETRIEPESTWIDVGTGTGVLAILAAKLGARHVYAFDNNEWSILNSQENIDRNDVADRITLEQIELQEATLDRCDGLAANLYRHLVIPYAPAFVKSVRPGGVIAVSGILKYDVDEVAAPFLDLGCVAEETLYESEWAAIAFRTPDV